MQKNEEIEKIKEKIVPILKEYKVTKAGIFGSYSRGEQKVESDVDILIELNDDSCGIFELIDLKFKLQKAIRKKIDLVEYENIRNEIKENIFRDEISILV